MVIAMNIAALSGGRVADREKKNPHKNNHLTFMLAKKKKKRHPDQAKRIWLHVYLSSLSPAQQLPNDTEPS